MDHDDGTKQKPRISEIKYYAFDLFVDKDAVFGVEKLVEIKDDLLPLHEEHWKETEVNYLKETRPEPDYERLGYLTEAGQFVLFTVRVNRKVVGYVQFYVFRDLHAQNMYQAREDAFFVTKEHRGSGLAPRLLSFAEKCLRNLGCNYIGMTSKHPVGGPDIGKFLEKRGYKPVAMYYAKPLE